jgi:recombination protein RecR
MQYVEPISRLISAFAKLPGIGEKTAGRLALYVLNVEKGYASELAESLMGVKENISLCTMCMGFSDIDPCALCSDSSRDASLVCVVSDFKDMAALEATGHFTGVYHILHGNLAPLKGVGPDEIKIGELVERVRAGGVSEIILATGFDVEGDATANYLLKILKSFDVKVTRIASGVPVGSYIEYMDPSTLDRAMNARKEIS